MTSQLYKASEVLIDEIYIADTFIKRLRGYMFYKKPPYKSLVIKPCNSIHTYFMTFNIDVLFLDHEMMVIHKVIGLKKNKLIKPIKNAHYVIETYEGGFSEVNIGDIMSIC